MFPLSRGKRDLICLNRFPDGFRMVSGSPMLRTPGSSLEQQAIDFVCLRYNAGQANSYGNQLPATNCEAGLRAQVAFPCACRSFQIGLCSCLAQHAGMDTVWIVQIINRTWRSRLVSQLAHAPQLILFDSLLCSTKSHGPLM